MLTKLAEKMRETAKGSLGIRLPGRTILKYFSAVVGVVVLISHSISKVLISVLDMAQRY